MAVKFQNGDLFAESVDAVVNAVNCVGIMGKGVALEFKRRWPENFKAYKELCDAKWLTPGKLFIFETGDLITSETPKYLVNFPTKDHWRSKSQLSYIEDGLDSLVNAIRDYGITSIAIPPLGCGNGGLDWSDVKPIISSKLCVLSDVDVIVLEPKQSIDAPEHMHQNFLMTFERAILLKCLVNLEKHFDGEFDRISLQKIVYFLQALGINFQLVFSKDLHGPYSETLKNAFETFDKKGMIKGFLSENRQTHVTPTGVALADQYLKDYDGEADAVIDRLGKLIQGYESPYGLELLSSVHWLAHHEGKHPVDEVIRSMLIWNDDKRNSFDEKAIRLAYQRLYDDGLV